MQDGRSGAIGMEIHNGSRQMYRQVLEWITEPEIPGHTGIDQRAVSGREGQATFAAFQDSISRQICDQNNTVAVGAIVWRNVLPDPLDVESDDAARQCRAAIATESALKGRNIHRVNAGVAGRCDQWRLHCRFPQGPASARAETHCRNAVP
jgi:hypothetical protein